MSPITQIEASQKDVSSLIHAFALTQILSHDRSGLRLVLLGTIHDQPGILILERAAFPSSPAQVRRLTSPSALPSITTLNSNDIYAWCMADSVGPDPASPSRDAEAADDEAAPAPNVKISLIHPCTPKHVAKYTPQRQHTVTETPAIFRTQIRPLMLRDRAQGRLNWVYNILDGRAEQKDVLYRSHPAVVPPTSDSASTNTTSPTLATAPSSSAFPGATAATPAPAPMISPTPPPDAHGFLLLPDLNWDRKTLSSLHLLALPLRRDLLSLRDLRREHVPFLKRMRDEIVEQVGKLYPGGEAGGDEEGEGKGGGGGRLRGSDLKMYFHYQPTYYHLHVHAVHVMHDGGMSQAVGKAWGLEAVVAILENLAEGKGMADLEMVYTIGENHEIWRDVFAPLAG